MSTEAILIAVILNFVLGGALGNYATSLVHRLPVKEPLFEKHPFCGSCKNFLKPRDLFPVFSFLWNLGKCRFCGVKIPRVHFMVELLSISVLMAAYFTVGLSEQYILLCAIGIFWIMLAAIAIRSQYIETILLYWLLGLVVILRVLDDHSIYPFFFDGVVMVLFACWAYRTEKITLNMGGVWMLAALLNGWPIALATIAVAHGIEWGAKKRLQKRETLVVMLVGLMNMLLLFYSYG